MYNSWLNQNIYVELLSQGMFDDNYQSKIMNDNWMEGFKK